MTTAFIGFPTLIYLPIVYIVEVQTFFFFIFQQTLSNLLTGGCYIFSIFVVFTASLTLKWMLLHSTHKFIQKYIVTGDRCYNISTLITQLMDFCHYYEIGPVTFYHKTVNFTCQKYLKANNSKINDNFVLFFWKINHFIQSFMHYLDKLGILSLIVEVAHLGCRKVLRNFQAWKFND